MHLLLPSLILGVLLGICAVVTGVPRPTCPKYSSCTWNIKRESKLCQGVDEENVCPSGHPLCFTTKSGVESCCCITPNPHLKHLEGDDKNPPREEGKLRLYFMRFCPYCHRVALVTHAKNIATDIVYVNLRQNPSWFGNGTKLGKNVPLVETEKGNIKESLIVSDFLDETYPMPGELYPCDTIKKAIDRVLIDTFSKVTTALFSSVVTGRAFKNPEEVPSAINEIEECLTRLGNALEGRGTEFFADNAYVIRKGIEYLLLSAGSKPGMVDYMIWPWIERKPVLEMMFPNAFNYNNTNSQLAAWAEEMKMDKAVLAYGLAPEAHYTFLRSVQLSDQNPNYNFLAE